ncbi:MAG TPA: homogentisate 1,2-dioxygenase, partial [Amycolatopsis sp.]|nr:homogentisate 1,2-dioxygenase [Amycolatopsis sp.]
MPYYRRVGELPHKRHTAFRKPDGGLYAEELMGVEGFSADSALLYHRGLPTAIVDAVAVGEDRGSLTPNHPLKPRAFRTQDLKFGAEADAVTDRRRLFGNNDVTIGFVTATAPSPLYRNAAGDELFYVHGGSATFETIYGRLEVGDGDYVVIPTSCTYRVVPHGEVNLFTLEARGHIGPPKRYLSAKGQFLEHSPYCERDIRGPEEPLLEDGEDVEVLVRHRAGLTRYTYATHPFDVVG